MDFFGIAITVSLVGAVMGVTGGVFNSFTHNTAKLVAFTIWMCSNFILAYWTYSIGEYGVTAMYVAFIGTSLFGFYNHWKVHKDDREKLKGSGTVEITR